MNIFRTIIDCEPSSQTITHKDKVSLIGSCFTDNIGKKLQEHKFMADLNPFGIIYNPSSVKNSIEALIQEKEFTENDLFYHNERWNSFLHHGDFSNYDKATCLKTINERIVNSAKHLRESSFIFITFGTAWVYKHKKTDKIVSNCHKVPAGEFNRYLLNIEEIVDDYIWVFKRLQEYNPDAKLIFTVSPVRHLKDGAHGNQISKSTLLLAINQLQNIFPEIEYFPAYEIAMDDLRDYRFYADDMVHPSNLAVDYIWNRFSETYFNEGTINLMDEIKKLKQAFMHRPFNPESDSFKSFRKNNRKKTEELINRYPHLNFDEELEFFSNKL